MSSTPHDRRPTHEDRPGSGGRPPTGPDAPTRSRGPGGAGRSTGPAGRGVPSGRAGAASGPGSGSHRTSTRGSRRATRRALRHESPSVIAVLATEADFTAMQGYASFPFTDHARYLRQVDGWLRARTLRGEHTTIALFAPDLFRAFCSETRLDPDRPTSRARYAAEAATTGPTLRHRPVPLTDLVTLLRSSGERHVTLDRAMTALTTLDTCTACGEGATSTAFGHAGQAIEALLRGARPGRHHLVCSVPLESGSLIAALHMRTAPGAPASPSAEDDDRHALRMVLAVGLAGAHSGGVVLRTTGPDERDTVHGWALRDGWLAPLTEAQVFSAYCTDPDTGEPVSPEPGVEYGAGFPLPHPDDQRQ